jgi:hypothetical protein
MGYLTLALKAKEKLKGETGKVPDRSIIPKEIADKVAALLAAFSRPPGDQVWTGSELRTWITLVDGLLLPGLESALDVLPASHLVALERLVGVVNWNFFVKLFAHPERWLQDNARAEYKDAVAQALNGRDKLSYPQPVSWPPDSRGGLACPQCQGRIFLVVDVGKRICIHCRTTIPTKKTN